MGTRLQVDFVTRSRTGLCVSVGLNFCDFLLSAQWEENSVFKQIEQLFAIDLSLLVRSAMGGASINRYLESLEKEFSYALQSNNQDYLNEIYSQITKAQHEQLELEGDSFTPEWADINALKTTVDLLLNHITAFPDYHQKIQYSSSWNSYFTFMLSENQPTLKDDLILVQQLIQQALAQNERYACFQYSG